MCGKIWDVKYIGPNTWNEYKTNINLDFIKNYVNSKFNFSCNELKVMFQVSKKITYEAVKINIDNNENKLGYINSLCRIEIYNKINDRLYRNDYLNNKECQSTMENLKDEIKG